MDAKKIAAIIAASARATLLQVPGFDRSLIEAVAAAIANNAATVLALELEIDVE